MENPRVYYGEGSATMAFSNVDRMKELDYPTAQDRAETVLPAGAPIGVPVDSLVKRLVFGWRSGKFFELVFSDLIQDTTRVHYYRTPLERIDRVAPFLFLDSNPYAVAVDGGIQWIVNAMTTTDRYPYSFPEELGDKSDERSAFPRPERLVNYIEDSVKATVDAYTGRIHFYKIRNSPIVDAWSKIYPGLFLPAAQMPAGVARQLTYPTQLFHIQFDDLYIYYHMKDPMYFFNMEDMWDDGDEVLGPDSRHREGDHLLDRALHLDGRHGPSRAAARFGASRPVRSRRALHSREGAEPSSHSGRVSGSAGLREAECPPDPEGPVRHGSRAGGRRHRPGARDLAETSRGGIGAAPRSSAVTRPCFSSAGRSSTSSRSSFARNRIPFLS